MVRTPACHAGGRGFKSHPLRHSRSCKQVLRGFFCPSAENPGPREHGPAPLCRRSLHPCCPTFPGNFSDRYGTSYFSDKQIPGSHGHFSPSCRRTSRRGDRSGDMPCLPCGKPRTRTALCTASICRHSFSPLDIDGENDTLQHTSPLPFRQDLSTVVMKGDLDGTFPAHGHAARPADG